MQDGTKKQAAEARQARLAEALRENLKRRKSQTRARKDVTQKTEKSDPPEIGASHEPSNEPTTGRD